MGTVRFFEEQDIDQVVGLNVRSFPASSVLSTAEQMSRFREVCFHNPWYHSQIRSLVYEESDGRISGFLGVVPRFMQFQGQTVMAAVAQHLMVEQSMLASAQLFKAFLAGSQELSISDMGVDISRRLWERVGGATAFSQSVYWRRPLRPLCAVVDFMRRNKTPALVGRALMPIAHILDSLVVRPSSSPYFQQAPRTTIREADADTLLECLNDAAASLCLRPEYDCGSLSWLLRLLGNEKRFGEFRKIVVLDDHDKMLGWSLYYLKSGGRSEVIQIEAASRNMPTVLAHIFYEAWHSGSFEITGRLDPRYMKEFSNAPCVFSPGKNWMLVHSRNKELLNAIFQGNVFLTRLEGDLWFF